MSAIKIEKLTPDQDSQIKIWFDKWHATGICTDPADRPRAEEAIVKMYELIGKSKPRFVWVDSPITANLMCHILQKASRKQDKTSLEASLEASLRDSLRDSLEASGDSKVEVHYTSFWGQQDSYWIAFYKFCRDVVGVKYEKKDSEVLDLWADIAESAMWFWPYENICIVSERPSSVKMDVRRRIHSLDSAAVTFRDGWSVYAIHGVRVPEKYVLTPAYKIDPKEVLKESNAEVRTAVIKKCGFDHFRKHLDSKLISASNGNELLEFDLGASMKVRGLLLRWIDKHDSKETILPVPRTLEQFKKTGDVPDDINDCEQVRRWTLHLTKDEELVNES